MTNFSEINIGDSHYVVLGHSQCTYCKQAIQLLATKGKHFTYVDVRAEDTAGQEAKQHLVDESITSVPYIVKIYPNDGIDDEVIGGYIDLAAHLG